MTPTAAPSVHDFDFIHGRWTVEHRRLKARGVGANDWDCFPSTSYCEPRLGGLANVEEVDCPARGWTGLAFRLFDIETQEWTVRWVNSTNGVLQPPVRGRFHAGRCVLEGPDTDEGRPIIAHGQLKTNEYVSENGERRSDLEMTATAVGLDLTRCRVAYEGSSRVTRSTDAPQTGVTAPTTGDSGEAAAA